MHILFIYLDASRGAWLKSYGTTLALRLNQMFCIVGFFCIFGAFFKLISGSMIKKNKFFHFI